MDTAYRFLVHPDLFSCSRDSVLSKALFYTDLKMPDQMSAHTHFLLNPQLLYSDHKTPLGESLVLMCSPPSDSEATRKMMAGTLCPVPCYKKVRWYDDVLEISERGVKRRRKAVTLHKPRVLTHPATQPFQIFVCANGDVVQTLVPSRLVLLPELRIGAVPTVKNTFRVCIEVIDAE